LQISHDFTQNLLGLNVRDCEHLIGPGTGKFWSKIAKIATITFHHFTFLSIQLHPIPSNSRWASGALEEPQLLIPTPGGADPQRRYWD